MNSPKSSIWIVDDVQRVVEITDHQETNGSENPKVQINGPRSHAGQIYAKEFCYASGEAADAEVADRHTRLNKALLCRDLLLCLSIQKEPNRKSQGATANELKAFEAQDKTDYKNWVDTLKRKWEEIHHEQPEIKKLVKTLRTAQIIQEALKEDLAVEFIEIMAREGALKNREYLAGPE